MNKEKLWTNFMIEIQRELDIMKESVASTTQGATHAESKQEGKYDTRGLEASYLAGGQQRRVADLENTVNYFNSLKEVMISHIEVASFGALVEVEHNKKRHHYFIGQFGGGIKVSIENIEVQIITHKSPIGSEVLGLEEGDSFEIEGPRGQEELQLIKVY